MNRIATATVSLLLALAAGAAARTSQAPAQAKIQPPKAARPEGWDYADPMKKVAARFRGTEGVVLHVGGSMTIANP